MRMITKHLCLSSGLGVGGPTTKPLPFYGFPSNKCIVKNARKLTYLF